MNFNISVTKSQTLAPFMLAKKSKTTFIDMAYFIADSTVFLQIPFTSFKSIQQQYNDIQYNFLARESIIMVGFANHSTIIYSSPQQITSCHKNSQHLQEGTFSNLLAIWKQ